METPSWRVVDGMVPMMDVARAATPKRSYYVAKDKIVKLGIKTVLRKMPREAQRGSGDTAARMFVPEADAKKLLEELNSADVHRRGPRGSYKRRAKTNGELDASDFTFTLPPAIVSRLKREAMAIQRMKELKSENGQLKRRMNSMVSSMLTMQLKMQRLVEDSGRPFPNAVHWSKQPGVDPEKVRRWTEARLASTRAARERRRAREKERSDGSVQRKGSTGKGTRAKGAHRGAVGAVPAPSGKD